MQHWCLLESFRRPARLAPMFLLARLQSMRQVSAAGLSQIITVIWALTSIFLRSSYQSHEPPFRLRANCLSKLHHNQRLDPLRRTAGAAHFSPAWSNSGGTQLARGLPRWSLILRLLSCFTDTPATAIFIATCLTHSETEEKCWQDSFSLFLLLLHWCTCACFPLWAVLAAWH